MDNNERLIYEKLNSDNRAGHIKEILKEVLIMGSQMDTKKIEEIVLNILSSNNYKKEEVKNEYDVQNISDIAKQFIK